MDLKSIPKIELHVHLDGSVRPKTLSKLANISIDEAIKSSIASDKCNDLNDYLTRFTLPIKVMQTYENIKLISMELAEDLKNDGVIYAEIRFAPIKHTQTLTLDEVINAVLDGLSKVDIKTKLILCMMRDDSFENNKKVIDLARKYLGKVGGIDLAGAESLYKTKNFKELFDYAKKLNIPFTIHAGEADGVDSINSAIDFGAKRIGHGIRCIEDKNTLNRIIKEEILLEICPTSNVQTNVVDKYSNHPLFDLYKKGVIISINTDNRTVSNVTLTGEYKKLSENFDLTISDFININKNIIKYTFTNEIEKEEIKQCLENRT